MSDPASTAPKVRAFIGVDLSTALRSHVADLLTRLQKGTHFTGARPLWVRPESLHLTLKFLGEIDDLTRARIVTALRPVAGRHAPHGVHAKGLGVFPSPRAPRVLWLGVRRADALLALQTDIERTLVAIGFEPEDRPFSPHLTLARLKSHFRAQAFMDVIQSHARWDLGLWGIGEFLLFQSTLHPSGPVYTALHRFPLTAPPPEPRTH